MTEDNFDNKIRKKLESIQPEYSEAAWQKLYKSIPLPWYQAVLRDYGSWLYGGVTTVALLGVYVNNLNLKKENQLLNEKTSTIKISENQNTKIDTVFSEKTNTDTIYITKVIYKDALLGRTIDSNFDQLNKNEAIQSENLQNSETNKPENFKTKDEVSEQKIRNNKASAKNSELNPGPTNANKSEKSNLPETIVSKANSYATVEEKNQFENKKEVAKNNSINSDGSEVALIPKNEAVIKEEFKNLSTESNNNVIAKNEQQVVDQNRSVTGQTEPAKTDLSEAIKSKGLIIPDRKESQDRHESTIPNENVPKKSGMSLPKLSTRVGITSDNAFLDSRNFGPILEMFFGKNFSLNTGALFSTFNKRGLAHAIDFDSKTGRKFEERYKEQLIGKPQRINDIEINSTQLMVPVIFSYYFPAYKKISAYLSAGTKLNAYSEENVSFKERNLGEVLNRKFEYKPQTKVFDNMYYGLGVQYNLKKIFFQAAPYFDIPLKDSPFLGKRNKFGINAAVKYRISKR